eukprot:5933160-Amphidinium_carterae.2
MVTVRTQDVRPRLQYWSDIRPVATWAHIEKQLQALAQFTAVLIKPPTDANHFKKDLWLRIEEWACTTLHVFPVAARLFHGCRILRSIPEYPASLTVRWRSGAAWKLQFTDSNSSYIRLEAEELASNHCKDVYGIQLLFDADDADYHQQSPGITPPAAVPPGASTPSTSGRLSTIPEESNSGSLTDGEDLALANFSSAERVMGHYLADDLMIHDPASMAVLTDGVRPVASEPAELLFHGVSQKLLPGIGHPHQGFLSMSLHEPREPQRITSERDDDVLTTKELEENSVQVKDEMLDELKRWCTEYKVCERRSRASSRNIIDIRWVIKWKYKLSSTGSRSRGIRARLTVRGFKDMSAEGATFSAIATRLAHRNWELASLDVRKAFLQGATYAELAEEGTGVVKEVCFEVPPGTVAILRRIHGYETFDPKTEVLGLLKPGNGLRDAPRAFSVKLRKRTREFGWVSSTVDPELELLWDSKRSLVGLLCKHVDDIKIASPREVREQFKKHLYEVFGELDEEIENFTNCGVQHQRDPKTRAITLNQTKFIMAIKRCPLAGAVDARLTEPERRQFLLSLMTVATYSSVRDAVTLTRIDVLPYITALQRVCQEPTYRDVGRLNKLIKYLQSNPRNIEYHPMPTVDPDRVVAFSDSAFAAEGHNAAV